MRRKSEPEKPSITVDEFLDLCEVGPGLAATTSQLGRAFAHAGGDDNQFTRLAICGKLSRFAFVRHRTKGGSRWDGIAVPPSFREKP